MTASVRPPGQLSPERYIGQTAPMAVLWSGFADLSARIAPERGHLAHLRLIPNRYIGQTAPMAVLWSGFADLSAWHADQLAG